MMWLLIQNKIHNIFHSILSSDYFNYNYNNNNSDNTYIVLGGGGWLHFDVSPDPVVRGY